MGECSLEIPFGGFLSESQKFGAKWKKTKEVLQLRDPLKHKFFKLKYIMYLVQSLIP